MFNSFDEVQKMIMGGDQADFDKNGGNGYMQNFEAQYHKEARKREIERMKKEFMDLKARNFKKKKDEAAKAGAEDKKDDTKDDKKEDNKAAGEEGGPQQADAKANQQQLQVKPSKEAAGEDESGDISLQDEGRVDFDSKSFGA